MNNSEHNQKADRLMHAGTAKEGGERTPGGNSSAAGKGRSGHPPAGGPGPAAAGSETTAGGSKPPEPSARNGRGNNGTGGDYKRHTLSLFVANKPGVLIRIALVFARRGYNIDSLVVSESNDPRYSTMNIVAAGDARGLDQILKQLNKLVDVVHASDRTGEDIIKRELALIKLKCEPETRSDVLQLSHALQCDIVEVTEHATILQMTGDSERLDSAYRVFERYGVQEMIRTGKVLMARGQEFTP